MCRELFRNFISFVCIFLTTDNCVLGKTINKTGSFVRLVSLSAICRFCSTICGNLASQTKNSQIVKLSHVTLSALPHQLFIKPLYLLNSLNKSHKFWKSFFAHWQTWTSLRVTFKQWQLTPNLGDSQITRANLARGVTFFSKMDCDECQQVLRVLAKRLGVCRGVWRVLPKVDIFGRVLALAKFARE